METSRPLAIDSFSYSWLSNVYPFSDCNEESLEASLNCSLEAISKEMDFKTVKSKRFDKETQNFNFDFPTSQSPPTLLYADELFSDGLIKPASVNPSKIEASSCNTSDFIIDLPRACSLSSRNIALPASQHHYHVLKKWRKSSHEIMQKCFGYLRPLCYRVESSRKSNRVDDIDRRVREATSWSNSPQSFPQQSIIENSIYEAVLHCKRSIEKESGK